MSMAADKPARGRVAARSPVLADDNPNADQLRSSERKVIAQA